MLGMISDVIIQVKETKVKNKYHLQKRKNQAENLGNFTMRFFGHKKTALSEERAVKLWS
ncbi:hypothetical protein [Butyricicoccus pullicaecorum]|nr:hypothetical protein [Butyricicoccus pullicaecorum]